jgi:type II secretory pathway pseudopilin PulG
MLKLFKILIFKKGKKMQKTNILTKKNGQMKKNWKKGMALIDLILTIGAIAIIVGALVLILFPKVKTMINKNEYKNDFNIILSGLKDYYGDNSYYPGGEGWEWNKDNAYVPQEIIDKGWDYKCDSDSKTITITTPNINDKKILVGIALSLKNITQKNNGDASIDGKKVKVELYDKICK